MEATPFNASVRAATGKGVARKLRASGRIPATVYGGGKAPVSLALDPRDLGMLRRETLGWNSPLSLSIDGGDDTQLVMLADVQKHPLNGAYLHADFKRIEADEDVVVSIRVDLEGRAAGIALGGKLSRPVRHVKVACKPADIPDRVLVDISAMNIGDKVMVDELPLPDGVQPVFNERFPVVAIVKGRGGAKAG